jgi:hypothetical protein
VSIGIKDYSFSEIAQIVEGNNARLLGAFITDAQNDLVEITLKDRCPKLERSRPDF